jgi:hypothetical protein
LFCFDRLGVDIDANTFFVAHEVFYFFYSPLSSLSFSFFLPFDFCFRTQTDNNSEKSYDNNNNTNNNNNNNNTVATSLPIFTRTPMSNVSNFPLFTPGTPLLQIQTPAQQQPQQGDVTPKPTTPQTPKETPTVQQPTRTVGNFVIAFLIATYEILLPFFYPSLLISACSTFHHTSPRTRKGCYTFSNTGNCNDEEERPIVLFYKT